MQDFEVDENSLEYLALHPLAPTAQPSLVEEHFEPVIEDEDHSFSDSDASAASLASHDEDKNNRSKDGKKSRVPRYTIFFYTVFGSLLFICHDCLCMQFLHTLIF